MILLQVNKFASNYTNNSLRSVFKLMPISPRIRIDLKVPKPIKYESYYMRHKPTPSLIVWLSSLKPTRA